jgi:hypothetical protein
MMIQIKGAYIQHLHNYDARSRTSPIKREKGGKKQKS